MPQTKGTFKLTIDPKDSIVFNGPFDKETVVDLKLTNDSDKRRAFKVKCTANSLFRIRPAVGKLEPSASATVKLSCKALEDKDVPGDDKHLFSVYHIVMESDDAARKAWADHKGDAEGTVRLDVKFKKAGGDDKKDDKKEEEKKDDSKKDDKKDEEKKDEDKKEGDEKKEDGEKEEEKKEEGEEKKEEDKKEE